uniref:Protein kinase domain-containing protein n=1 Tax=Salix viminalis TaxID=40686 RepID=A0A6N2LFF6_SALVM
MKCFHFTSGERREDEDVVVSKVSRVSWARSFSVASSSLDARRSDLDSDSNCYSSRDLSESVGFFDLLSQRRTNDLESQSELKSATRGFNRGLLIGEGGFGCVYRGVVKVPDDHDSDSKMDVAIKQLNRVVKHPNLVKLVGYCAEDDERGIQRLLVYELMRNKSLEDHLLAKVLPVPLPWMTRLKVAQDAARGLAYLHEEMDFQLIFRDFKASNVLLDEDFNAKLSDFGLARLGPPEGLGHVSTSVVGTVGYAAPEYVHTGRLTAKSDVWSFGVVMYELITGRRAVERNLPRGEQKLLEWVKPFVSDSKKFHLILDPRLEGQYCIKSAQKLSAVANKCIAKQPKSRPKMSEVVEMLGNIIDEISSQDEDTPEPASEIEEAKEEATGETEAESNKQGNNNWKKVFDIREMVNLRNRSIGKLDWRNWTPGLVRTS